MMFMRLFEYIKKWLDTPVVKTIEREIPEAVRQLDEAPSLAQVHDGLGGVVPYDEYLLERSRTQWQFGDWLSLSAITLENIRHHPDRAKLALLAAAGRLQMGRGAEARQLLGLARDWGASKRLISQVLISGVNNSMGNFALLAGQQSRSNLYFERAIGIGLPGADIKLLARARLTQQSSHLGEVLGAGPLLEGAEPGLAAVTKANAPSANVQRSTPVRGAQPVKLETGGANILIRDIVLTEQSKKRWPYFLKIEELQVVLFLHLIKDVQPDIFLDIGANVGFYTLIAEKYFPNLRCVAFEPAPETYNHLYENLRVNSRTRAGESHCLALSDRKGVVEFGDFGDCSGKNGVLSTSIHDAKDIQKKFSVPTETLDSLYPGRLGRVIMKIDTEGHEFDVLKGAESLLSSNEVVLQIETGHKGGASDLDEHLESVGFERVFVLGPDSYYTNIAGMSELLRSSQLLEKVNQMVIAHRWDQEVQLSITPQ